MMGFFIYFACLAAAWSLAIFDDDNPGAGDGEYRVTVGF